MVRKATPTDADDGVDDPALSKTVRQQANEIWLAGLGAFAKAQEEGSKVFEALVKEGQALQRKTQTVAEERFSQASERVAHAADELSSRAAGQWDKLESIFEDRVAKALKGLGVPSACDLQALADRIDQLERAQARQTTQRKPD